MAAEATEASTTIASFPTSIPPGDCGKVGMRYFRCPHNKSYRPTVNVDRLRSLVPDDVKKSAVACGDNSSPSIGVARFSYFKISKQDAPAYQPLY